MRKKKSLVVTLEFVLGHISWYKLSFVSRKKWLKWGAAGSGVKAVVTGLTPSLIHLLHVFPHSLHFLSFFGCPVR